VSPHDEDALIPPNPNEFEMIVSGSAARPEPAT
jgi:hypothetical protein